MSSLTSLYGGGGGTPVNSISRLYVGGQTQYTDESGGVWLKTGNTIVSDPTIYPDVFTFSDISASTYDNKSLYISQASGVGFSSFDLNNDGTKLFAYTRNNRTLHQYSLSTPYDLSTGTYDNVSQTFSLNGTQDIDIVFGKNGERLYMSDDQNNVIRQYNLSTAYDITTASYSGKSISLNDGRDAPYSLTISPDGKKIHCTDAFNHLFQYTLSTPWELVTNPSFTTNTLANLGKSNPRGFAWNEDGSLGYLYFDSDKTIVELIPTAAYDVSIGNISSANTTGKTYTISGASMNEGKSLRWFGNLQKFYIASDNNFFVYQFTYPLKAGLSTDTGTYDYLKLK